MKRLLPDLRKAQRPLMLMALRFGSMAAKFILTIFITAWMGLETLGLYGLIAGLTVFGPALAGFGLSPTLVREIVTQPANQFMQVVLRCWVVMAAGYLLLWLPLAIGLTGLTPWHGLVLVTLLLVFLEHLSGDMSNLLINRDKPVAGNIVFFTRAGGWVWVYLGVAWQLPALRTLEALLAAWGLGIGLSMVFFALFSWHWVWPWRAVGPGIWPWALHQSYVAWRFYLADLSNSVGQYLDRYMIGLFLNLELVGVYVFFWSLMNALYNLLNTGLLQTLKPKLIRLAKQAEAQFTHTWRLMLGATMATGLGLSALMVVGFMLAPLAWRTMPENLLQNQWLLWLLLGGMHLRLCSEVLNQILYAKQLDKSATTLTMLTLPLAALLQGVFIPLAWPWAGAWGGLIGAGVASVVLYLIICSLRAWVVYRHVGGWRV